MFFSLDNQNVKRVKKECTYGEKCYRLNPAHFREFSHPHCKFIFLLLLQIAHKKKTKDSILLEFDYR